MATYYWVGGTGTWNTSSTTNWASSSNGPGGAGVPTSVDDVIIDSFSGTGTITCTGAVCRDLTSTATQAIFLGAASSTLSVFGNFTLPSGGSFIINAGLTITFAATTTGKTITTNGKNLDFAVFNGIGGGWTLGSALSVINGLTLTNGTLDTSSTNNYSISCLSFSVQGGTKTLNLNASTMTITLTGSGTVWNIVAPANFTLNAGTSTINIQTPGPTFAGGSLTYYNVNFSSTAISTIRLQGSNIFNNLSFTSLTSDGTALITTDSNITINGTLTLGTSNTAVRRMLLRSSTNGVQRTITATTVATLSDVDFADISFSGTAKSGTRLGNAGGNSNITFDVAKTVYWNLAGTQNWSATAWATTNNGTPAANNFPLAQDTAVFTEAGAAGTVTINGRFYVGTVTMADGVSNRSSAMTLNFSQQLFVCGDFVAFSNLTLGAGTSSLVFVGRTTQNFNPAGRTFNNFIEIDNATGTVLLQSNLTVSGASTTLTSGTFNANNYNLTLRDFISSGTIVRTLTMGSGLWTLTGTGTVWNLLTSTNLTFNRGTANIVLTDTSASAKTFAGGGLTYNGVTLGAGGGVCTYTISGSNIFSSLSSNKTSAFTLSLTSGTTQTVTTWGVNGSAGNVLTLQRSSVTAATIAKSGGGTATIDYATITGITGSPAATWFATNSTNGGNNSNISFITSSGNFLMFFV